MHLIGVFFYKSKMSLSVFFLSIVQPFSAYTARFENTLKLNLKGQVFFFFYLFLYKFYKYMILLRNKKKKIKQKVNRVKRKKT